MLSYLRIDSLNTMGNTHNSFQATLSEADLSSSRKLRECAIAAKALQRVLSADLDPSLAEMKSAQSQIKRCEKLRDRFARAVFKHLTNHFVHLGNDTEHLDAGTSHLKLSRRWICKIDLALG